MVRRHPRPSAAAPRAPSIPAPAIAGGSRLSSAFVLVAVGRSSLLPAVLALFAVAGAPLLPGASLAAQAPGAELRIGMRGDSVVVYHTAVVPLGGGAHLDRDTGQGWERVTEEPLMAARDPGELRTLLGPELYGRLADDLEQPHETGVFFQLRADRILANLTTFLHPEVAIALGRRLVDPEPPAEGTVRYRVTLMDAAGEPTQTVLEGEADPSPAPSRAAHDLEATFDGTLLTLEWRYPLLGPDEDDGVVSFEVVLRDRATGREEILSRRPFLRLANEEAYEFRRGVEARDATVEVAVRPVAFTGARGEPTRIQVDLTDPRPPAPVEEVRVEDVGERVVVSWPEGGPSSVAGYHVWRARELHHEFRRITEEALPAGRTHFVDEAATRGRFFYRVSAVDAQGRQGEPGAAAMVVVRNVTPPPTPTALSAEHLPEGDVVRLSWEDPEPAPDLLTYLLLRRRADGADGGGWSQVNRETIREHEIQDPGPTEGGWPEGVRWEFALVAVDSARNMSDTVRHLYQVPKTTPPAPPRDLRATNDRGLRALLRWNPSPHTDVTRYAVYRQDGGGAEARLGEVAAGRGLFRDEGVEPEGRYVYAVAAIDSLGNEGPVAEAEPVLVRRTSPPRAPRNVRAEAVSESGGEPSGVRIRWEPLRGEEIRAYRIERASRANAAFETVHEGDTGQDSWTDPSGRPGLWYRVRTVDVSGNASPPGRPVQATTPRGPGGGP